MGTLQRRHSRRNSGVCGTLRHIPILVEFSVQELTSSLGQFLRSLTSLNRSQVAEIYENFEAKQDPDCSSSSSLHCGKWHQVMIRIDIGVHQTEERRPLVCPKKRSYLLRGKHLVNFHTSKNSYEHRQDAAWLTSSGLNCKNCHRLRDEEAYHHHQPNFVQVNLFLCWPSNLT